MLAGTASYIDSKHRHDLTDCRKRITRPRCQPVIRIVAVGTINNMVVEPVSLHLSGGA